MGRGLHMWKSSDGRDAVPVWSVAQRVFGAIDGVAGYVISVGPGTFCVTWSDGTLAVDYPEDTIMVRKGFP